MKLSTKINERIVIRQSKYVDVAGLASRAKKERVSMANPEGAIWFCAYSEDNVVGFVCLVINKRSGVARFKSDYVIDSYRGYGLYKSLFRLRMVFCSFNKVKKVTAFCTPMSYPTYIKNGFKPKSKKGDIVFVEKVLC